MDGSTSDGQTNCGIVPGICVLTDSASIRDVIAFPLMKRVVPAAKKEGGEGGEGKE